MANCDAAFHALADATRRDIVARLGQGAQTVTALAQGHDMALPSFMKHLKVLEAAGLIVSEKQGRSRICRLNPRGLRPAEAWLAEQRDQWQSRTDRLADFLEKDD